MTLSPFSTSPATPHQSWSPYSVDIELVRGTEETILDRLQPAARQESIALDLSRVERIDARGIAVLITLFCTARQAGNNFTVVQPSSHVLELLRIVGLDSILIAPAVNPATETSPISPSMPAFAGGIDECVVCPAA